jgi:hypothetical protein
MSKPQTLKASTNQEAFDKMVKHLFKQNARALSSDVATCTYYDPETKRRCAVGALLNGGRLTESERTEAIWTLINDGVVVAPPAVHGRLLKNMQQVHDDPYFWGPDGLNTAAVHEMRKIAAHWDLDSTVLEAAAEKAGL